MITMLERYWRILEEYATDETQLIIRQEIYKVGWFGAKKDKKKYIVELKKNKEFAKK